MYILTVHPMFNIHVHAQPPNEKYCLFSSVILKGHVMRCRSFPLCCGQHFVLYSALNVHVSVCGYGVCIKCLFCVLNVCRYRNTFIIPIWSIVSLNNYIMLLSLVDVAWCSEHKHMHVYNRSSDGPKAGTNH